MRSPLVHLALVQLGRHAVKLRDIIWTAAAVMEQ